MATAQVKCHFAVVKDQELYGKYAEKCSGELVPIEACQTPEKITGYQESYLILLRSGYLREYNKSKTDPLTVCEFHRGAFGLEFSHEFRQKKCYFRVHSGKPTKASLVEKVSYEHSKGLFYRHKMIMPYGIKICKACNGKIRKLLVGYDESEEFEATPTPPGGSGGSGGYNQKQELDLQVQNDTDTPPFQEDEKKTKDILIDFIRNYDPNFGTDRQEVMWQATKPLHKLGDSARYKMKITLGKVIAAAIALLSKCPEDFGSIWNFLKNSRIVEKLIGQDLLIDIYLEEIVLAWNKALDMDIRIQIMSLVAKLGYPRLKLLNPPGVKKTKKAKSETGKNNALSVDDSSSGSLRNKRAANFDLEFEDGVIPKKVMKLSIGDSDNKDLFPQKDQDDNVTISIGSVTPEQGVASHGESEIDHSGDGENAKEDDLETGDEPSAVEISVESISAQNATNSNPDDVLAEPMPKRKLPRGKELPNANTSPKTSKLTRPQISHLRHTHTHGDHGSATATILGTRNPNIHGPVDPVNSENEVENPSDSQMDPPVEKKGNNPLSETENDDAMLVDDSDDENLFTFLPQKDSDDKNTISKESVTPEQGVASPGESEMEDSENGDGEDDLETGEKEGVNLVDAGGDVAMPEVGKKVVYLNPPLTWYYYKKALVHADIHKAGGQPVEVQHHSREHEVTSKETIRMIIDFLTSEEVQQNVAYGTVQMKGPDGVTVRVARNIRRRQNNTIVKQLRVLLKENGLKVPAESTLRAIIQELPAGQAKEIKGLDPKYEEHRRAFRRFEEILGELHGKFAGNIPCQRVIEEVGNVELVEKVKLALKTCESYLLGYFVYHLAFGDTNVNHCVNLACSDRKSPFFSEYCSEDHLDSSEGHPDRCDYCDLLPAALSVLKDLIEMAPNLEDLDRRILEHDRNHGEKAIEEYKKQMFCHFVSSQTWNKYFTTWASVKRVMAVIDFGMKWEPQYHRETSTQHFGKKALTYHGVAYERIVDLGDGDKKAPLISTNCHIQVVKNTTLQDSDTVIALVMASLRDFKEANMDVEEIILKADNAGCYHCWATILRLWALRKSVDGIKIAGIIFGQAGKGKDACDKYFVFLRALQRRCLKEKYDADTPENFAANMCRNGGIANTTIQLGSVENVVPGEKKSLPSVIADISKLHGFLFKDDGIQVSMLPGFGDGKLYKIDPEIVENLTYPKFVCNILNKDNLDENLQNIRKTVYSYREAGKSPADVLGNVDTNETIEDDDQYEEETARPEDKVFICKNQVCGKPFLSNRARMNHKCVVRQKKMSSKNYAKEYYISKNGISKEYHGKSYQDTRSMVFHKNALPTIDDVFLDLIRSGQPRYRENLPEGHALSKKRERKTKSKHLIAFLDKMFDIGEKDKSKRKKPADISKELKRMADMTEADWLTETQVRDYWKRCTAQKRYDTPEPTVEQLEDYQNHLNARSHSKLADNIQRRLAEGLAKDDDSCPITVEGVQLCYLAASIKSSKKLSQSQIVGLEQKKLKDILRSLGIDDYGGGRATKLKMAKNICKYVEENCDCLMID